MIWLRSLLGLVTKRPDRRAGRPPRPAAFRPTLEVLETRETPSSLAHAMDTSGFLFGSGGGKGSPPDGDGMVFIGKGNHTVTYTI